MIKNIIIIVFIIIGLFVIYNFRDHNQKRAIDACIAGSQKLDQPMTIEEAKKFCEDQIKNK
ncbi:hypothetical protein [Candidatus Pelagibacter sp. HIMB1483]|uniref:hypothetical protein n=1 Tax=Candidatus Pelagibacter sp. HIMB1483 TaxID=3415414 RepID=UPI003F82B4E5